MIYIIILIVVIFLYFLFSRRRTKAPKPALLKTPEKWKVFLEQKVHFYKNLDDLGRLQFESDVQNFLTKIRITGVQVEVTIEDRLLVASSAIIPLFGFPVWSYNHLNEVLLYPDSFDRDYNIRSDREVITGMVGNGPMEDKVILSKPSLHLGFDINNDKKNVGIHEFVHLFDKATGAIDGIPPDFQDKGLSLPWLEFMRKKMDEIESEQSDINPYAVTNKQEFFAVASEYFFERPHLLQKKHPELYTRLSEIFNQNMTAIIDKSSYSMQAEVGRNSPCPCGSGEKYKKCCLV